MAFDTSWIQEFEENDKQYSDFYTEPIESVRLFILYVSKKNNLFHIKKDLVSLNGGCLQRDRLIKILKKNMHYNNKKYRPISILKYNINLEPEDVSFYIKDNKEFNFLNIENKIDTIVFEDSITLFHNINSIYIILHESWKSWFNKTKKIYIKSKTKQRKTKSKRFKAI